MRRENGALDALTAIRATIGLATYLTPDLVARLLGFRTPVGPELRYVCRIWGARNMALAIVTPRTSRAWRRDLLTANVAIDLADAASGAILVRQHRPGVAAGAGTIGPAAVAAMLGVAARRADAARSA